MSKARIPSAYEGLSPELAEILGAREPQSMFTNVGSVAATSLGPAGAPVVGQHFSRHVEEGNYGDALLDLIDLIPGAGLFKMLGAKALPYLSTFLPAGLLRLPIEQAKQARSEGVPIGPGSDFHRDTGMFEDPMGSILTEVSDHRAKLVGQPGKASLFGDLLDHPDLYNKLSDTEAESLYNTNVRAFTEKYLRENPTTTGAYQKGSKTLFFDANQSPDKLLEAVAHEGLGHRVQDITGMPGGADPDQIYKHLVDSDGYFKLLESGVPRAEAQAMARSAAYDLYRDKIGEVHAFDIGGRVKRSPAERLGISAPLIGTPRVQYWDKGDIPTADLMDQALELRQLEQLSRLGLFYQ